MEILIRSRKERDRYPDFGSTLAAEYLAEKHGPSLDNSISLKEKTRTPRLFFLSGIGWELHVLVRIDLHLGPALRNLDSSRPEDAVHEGSPKGLDAIVWMKVAKGDAERAAFDLAFPLECPRNNFLLTFGGHL